MRLRFLVREALLLLFALSSIAAHAQLFRAYLSLNGSDANPCTLVAPCRLLPAALKVKAVRAALDARGSRVRIAVGGAPFLFDPELWREVGADAMGRSAADAVAIVRRWTEEMA